MHNQKSTLKRKVNFEKKSQLAVDVRKRGTMNELTKKEAYAVCDFIDCDLYQRIRNDTDIDSIEWLKNILHAYEKLCKFSGYVGLTEHGESEE